MDLSKECIAADLFLDPQYKLLKKLNLSNYQETGENCQKCHVDEVDKLLSLKRILLKQLRYERCVSLSEAEWDEDLKLAKVTKIAKNLTKNYSHSYKGSIYLYPEECLCLLEMKCLILRWNERKLSIKNAYALLLQAGSGCTFEQFRTYGYLVKLGFRVFKYNNELKNNNYHKNDLTKVPEIPYKKKKDHVKKIRKFDSLICTPNNRESFPKLKSTGWVVISRPESCYLPHNILPNYDTYSFNIAVSSNSIKIIKVVPYYENMNLKKKKKFPKESMIYDSFLLTGNHPIYEKNILKTVKFDDTMYIPQIKKLKLNSLPITINMSSSSLSEERNLHPSKYEEKMKIEENSLTIINNTATVALTSNNNFYPSNIDEKMEIDKNYFPDCINMIASTLNNENNLCNITLKESHSVNINQKDLKDEVTEANSTFNLNFSSTVKSISSNKLEPTSSDTILEDETINKLLNLPSHIKQKLYAIKPSHDLNKPIEKIENVIYDVYYPDNDVPKKSRPAPDYRVIVIENDDTFPNIYNVNTFSPNDNVSTLWAIVNSSSVSFYNVNNIILPKSTDWEIKTNDD